MRKLWKFLRGLLVIALTVVLSTIAINATDNAGDLSNSLIGNVLQTERSACPEGMTQVLSEFGNFCIDKFEASASEECRFENPSSQRETQINVESSLCKAQSVEGTLPWRHVGRHQAEIACANAGKRLPSNGEWYKAAIGTPDPARVDGACNLNSSSNDPEPTGSRNDCVSSFGTHDMVGNVWEWVSGTVKNGLFEGSELPEEGYVSGIDESGVAVESREVVDPNFNADYLWVDTDGNRGMLRGGYFKSGTDGGVYTLNASVPSSFNGVGVGFRCVM